MKLSTPPHVQVAAVDALQRVAAKGVEVAGNALLEALDDDDPRCTLHKHAVVAERGAMDVVSLSVDQRA